MTIGELKAELAKETDDSMTVIVRGENESGDFLITGNLSTIVTAGCGDVEQFIIDAMPEDGDA